MPQTHNENSNRLPSSEESSGATGTQTLFSSGAVFSVAAESVRLELDRLENLREMLEGVELEFRSRQNEWDAKQAELDSVQQTIRVARNKHARRILRYRRIRNAFREIEALEKTDTQRKQAEIDELRTQLELAAQMLESSRDAVHLAEDEHRTEVEKLTEQLRQATQAKRELAQQLDSACEQVLELETLLEAMNRERLAAGTQDTAKLEELSEEVDQLRRKCRELESEKRGLAEEVAELRLKRPSGSGQSSQPSESMTWEQRKAAILEQLRREEMNETVSGREAESVRERLEGFDQEVQRRDAEIAELRELLNQQSATIQSHASGDVAIGAAGIAMMLESDELVIEERNRLKEIQREWEEKLRQAEVELSLERAKLARGRRELEQKHQELEDRLNQLVKDKQLGARPEDDKGPRRRWLKQLGLGDGP